MIVIFSYRIADIVRLKQSGEKNKNIAKYLNVSFETIKTAYKRFLAKVGMEPKIKVDRFKLAVSPTRDEHEHTQFAAIMAENKDLRTQLAEKALSHAKDMERIIASITASITSLNFLRTPPDISSVFYRPSISLNSFVI